MRQASARSSTWRNSRRGVPVPQQVTVSALLALRVSFGLAASAVDMPFAPRQSWVLRRGNGWTIMGVLFVIFLTAAVATMMSALLSLSLMRALGAGSAAAIVVWTVAILVSYAGAAVAATAQALIFRALTKS